MKLGEIIKQYREQHDLSLQQFGTLANMSKVYVSMLEKNFNPRTKKEIAPSPRVLQNVANAIGKTVDELLEMLDDDQLIHVVMKDNDGFVFSRSPHIENRFDDFVEELRNRDKMVLDGQILNKKETEIIIAVLENALDNARALIKLNKK